MRRLAKKDINTPQYYDEEIWIPEKMHEHVWDHVRLDALTRRFEAGDRVLDVGAGVRGPGHWFAQHRTDVGRRVVPKFIPSSRHHDLDVEVWCLDYSRVAREEVLLRAPSIIYVLGDALSTPFRDDYFNVVVAGELIEHIEEPSVLVEEMARVCRPGGWIAISTVDTRCEQAQAREYPEHLWEFEPEDLYMLFDLFGETTHELVGNYHFVETRRGQQSEKECRACELLGAGKFEESIDLQHTCHRERET